MSKGSVVFAAIVSACAGSGTERAPFVPPEMPRQGGPGVCGELPFAPPVCQSTPAQADLSPIDGSLVTKLGQQVTVASRPRIHLRCQLAACNFCCNGCGGPIMLCGTDQECSSGIEIGSCAGTECMACCSFKVRERMLVARGILEVREIGEINRSNPTGTLVFGLEEPEYCYLEDGS